MQAELFDKIDKDIAELWRDRAYFSALVNVLLSLEGSTWDDNKKDWQNTLLSLRNGLEENLEKLKQLEKHMAEAAPAENKDEKECSSCSAWIGVGRVLNKWRRLFPQKYECVN